MGYRKVDKGDRISEYVLLERLGQGGFGEVWKAEHSQIPGKYVAIKVPTRPESMEFLQKEAVFQHKLDHPNIVRTIGLDIQADPPYFIMEYVEGRNLRQFMKDEGILPPPYAIDVAVQVLEALAVAHARGIVHKDIKPENILVEKKRISIKEQKAFLHYVKITDLGLGKMPDLPSTTEMAMSEESRTTGMRVLTGTLFYSSPEQMTASRAIDERSDIYSVGVVLYEMMTGELPLGMDLPSELNPVVTPKLDQVCKKALSIDRDQRYLSARQMISDLVAAKEDFLLRLVAGGAPPAPKPATARSAPETQPRPAAMPALSRGHRLFQWTLAAAAAGLAIVSALLYSGRWHPGPADPPRPETSKAAPPLGGPVRFETVPAGATLVSGAEGGILTPCELTLPFERHQFLLSKEFHESRLLALEPRRSAGRRQFALIDERAKTEIALKECEQGVTFDRVTLTRQKGRLVLRTPRLEKVLVHLEGHPAGPTPYEDEVEAGLYQVRLTKEGYKPLEFEVRVAGGAPVVREFALVAEGASENTTARHPAHIATQPPGAAVIIDGERAAESTPCTLELAPGLHQLRLELSHHEPWEERVTVRGGPVSLHYTLARIQGRVLFESDPPGARILLDGREIGAAPITDLVPGGSHVAEFSMDGYFQQLMRFAVVDRSQLVPVKVTLQRIPPGQLTVECEIPNARVFVDEKPAGKAPVTGLKLEPGRHRIRVLGMVREVELDPGGERKLSLSAKDLGMTLVPAGEFEFGCNAREYRLPDLKAQRVTTPAYYIDLCEVTNEQYAIFLDHVRKTGDHALCDPAEGKNKEHTPVGWERGDRRDLFEPRKPVVGIDGYDAAAYAAWAGRRLPTEQEWEKAARGPDGRRYPWGNDWREEDRRCNWYDYRGEHDGFDNTTAPAGSFPSGRSPYGCLDMAGNVWEWTSTLLDPASSVNRIVRGTSYLQKVSPVWSRDSHPPNYNKQATIGFRCAADAR